MSEADGNVNDYNVRYLEKGIEISILENTKNQKFEFGVAFVRSLTERNEIFTWLAMNFALE